MASLYIKDPEVAELAAKVAALQGKTKTEAVKDALREVEARLCPAPAEESVEDFIEWVRELRRRHPVPRKAEHDRAIYDWMSDEEDE